MHHYYYTAPCTVLQLSFNAQDALVAVNGVDHAPPNSQPLTGIWKKKLDAYFSGRLHDFACPPSSQGTTFQQRVWQAIAQIPYGQVASYGDIARTIGSTPRAVGQACGKNPLPIIIPCHRVVAASGLGGFSMGSSEHSLDIKRWLLNHEGQCLP